MLLLPLLCAFGCRVTSLSVLFVVNFLIGGYGVCVCVGLSLCCLAVNSVVYILWLFSLLFAFGLLFGY